VEDLIYLKPLNMEISREQKLDMDIDDKLKTSLKKGEYM